MADEKLEETVASLRPVALLDHRHPVMYEDSIAGGVNALVRYFAALQRRDLRGLVSGFRPPNAGPRTGPSPARDRRSPG